MTDAKPSAAQAQGSLTDFGFEQVSYAEKTGRVADVFRKVAARYDLMNDLMSLGTHRLLKRVMLDMSAARPGDAVLDLAGGTGDMAMLLADLVGTTGKVVLADINAQMLAVSRDRMLERGYAEIHLVQADAEALPMPPASFDLVVISFGLRNFARKEQALAAIQHSLAPGGRLLVLEFSKPRSGLLAAAFDAYASLWPTLGKLVVQDAASYRYLVESISTHPDQETLSLMFSDAGFTNVRCHDLLGGVAALHIGMKPH